MVDFQRNSNADADESLVRRDEAKFMGKQHMASLFNSIADSMQFMGGVLLATGMAITIPSINFATVTNLATLGSAIAAASTVGLAFVGVAAVCTAAVICARMASSHYYHTGNYKLADIGAKHNAKYIVEELKSQNACIQQEYQQNGRSDGKTWVQAASEKQPQQIIH